MKIPISNYFAIFLVSVFFSALLLFGIYPYHPSGIVGWLALLLIAVPIAVAYQFFADLLLGNAWIKRQNTATRISYLFVVILLAAALSFELFTLAKPHLTTWVN